MKILKDKLSESVVTLGKFDCLHLGHKKLIQTAKENALKLGVPLVAYTFSNAQKSSVFSFEDRLWMFEEMGCDYVYVEEFNDEFRNLSPKDFFKSKLIDKLGAVHIVAGTDWRFGKDRAGDVNVLYDLCKKYNKGISVVDKLTLYDKEVSSTLIKKLFEDGDVKKANEYLGRCYYIKGCVCEGKKLGRCLGFPTANILLDDGLVYPKDGVYATKTTFDGKTYLSVTNIGTNPTVKDTTKRMETHILDFCTDLYGRCIKVEFLERIRGEVKFSDINALEIQVKKDIECVRCNYK